MTDLSPSEQPSLVRRAMQTVTEHIREKGLRVGDSLPGEAHFASQLGVSRAVISLNTRVLVDLGVVRNDAGTYSVDLERVAELHAALGQYLLP